MRRSRWVMLLGVIALFAAWGTARVVDSWRYQASLKQAKDRLDSGSPYEARRVLAESAARWPGEGEVEFLLGACEQALGRPDAAACSLVARADRFALCRARGHAPRPPVTEARPVRRGRGTAPRSPSGLGPARHRSARDVGSYCSSSRGGSPR